MRGIPALAIGRGKRNKYNAVRCEFDSHSFDSKAEMRFYAGNLKLRQMAGEITDLRIHPVYPLVVNGLKVCSYEPDFDYRDRGTGLLHVVDVKGGRITNTPASKLKHLLFRALYAIEVEIVECA